MQSDYGTMCLNTRDELIVKAAEFEVALKLNPKLSIDGNMYCFMYGESRIEGVTGYGKTVFLALKDFYHNFRFSECPKLFKKECSDEL